MQKGEAGEIRTLLNKSHDCSSSEQQEDTRHQYSCAVQKNWRKFKPSCETDWILAVASCQHLIVDIFVYTFSMSRSLTHLFWGYLQREVWVTWSLTDGLETGLWISSRLLVWSLSSAGCLKNILVQLNCSFSAVITHGQPVFLMWQCVGCVFRG